MKRILIFIWEIVKIVLVALLIVIPIRHFIFQPFFVKGQSMEPNFHSGDYLIVDEISYRFSSPKRGDVIVFRYPGNPKKRFIKRIIGLPGETVSIQDGKIRITRNGRKIVLDESKYLPSSTITPNTGPISLKSDEYFVLGDNRFHSFDSENWGPLPRKYIIGKVVFRAFPISALSKIKTPNYSTSLAQ